MTDLKDKIKIVINGKDYEVKFPTVGQYRQIESNKSILSGGVYGQMNSSMTEGSQRALNMVDLESTFRVLIPELSDDMKCEYKDLGIKDYLELEKVYIKQFLPWYNEWFKLLNKK